MKKRITTSGKKALSLVLTIAMLLSIVYLALPLNTAEAAGTNAPATNKRLLDNGDGTYTLALSVTGEAESSSTTEVSKANVVLVLDTSSSMTWSSGTTSEITYTEFTGTPDRWTEYWGTDDEGGYFRVYWRNRAWRTGNGNNSPVYNGTFYTREGGEEISRLEALQDALTKDGGIIDGLLAQNVAGDPNKSDIIEVAIVDFGGSSSQTQDFTTNATTLKNTINDLGTSTGTNWEDGLQDGKAYADYISAAGRQPDEDVYVIFLTDGVPTRSNSGTSWNTEGHWDYAKDDARAIVTSGYTLYGLFTWGSSNDTHYLSSLVQYAYTGSGNSNTELSSDYAKYYTDASDTDTLISALTQIVNDITQSVGYTNVELEDGVTAMTTSSVKTSVDGDVTGLKYYRSGGDYSTTANNGLGDEWTDAPAATINSDGEVDWNLGNIVLEDGVTYTVTFVVWPSQDSLDLVADLNNGVINYDDLTQAQKDQIFRSGNTYSLKTNTDYPTVTYSTVTTTTVNGQTTTEVSDPITANITNPDPVGLVDTKLNAVKQWDDSLDPSQRSEIADVLLYLKMDNEYYYVDDSGNPLGVTLTAGSNWTETEYLSIAPGIMVSSDSPAYDSTKPQITWNGKTYAILETGHDYVFEESDINNHFELTAYKHHPMQIDGTVYDVTFTKDASGNLTGIESAAAMTTTLSATNTLKPGVNIQKKVVDSEGNEITDTTDKFEVTVYLVDEEGNALPTKTTADGTSYTVDYRIYYGPNNPNYDAASGGGRSDHIYKSGTSFTENLYVGDVIRVVNVEAGALFRVEETDITGYTLKSTDYEISKGSASSYTAYDASEAVTLSGNTYYKTEGNSASQVTLTNTYTYGNLDISKTVAVNSGDEDQAKEKEFTFTVKLYADNTKAKELTDGTYNYTVYEGGAATQTTGTVQSGGTITLKDGQTAKIEMLPENAYYEVTEQAAAGYTTTKTGDTGTIVKDDTKTAAFTNTYSATPVVVDPPVKKDITGNDDLYNNGAFTFVIANTQAPEGVTAPMPTNTQITNSADYELTDKQGYYEFGEIEFTVPGTYVYTVTESGTVVGVTNDSEATKTITFTVTDNGEGALTVTPTTDSAVFSFTNEYKTGELDITKTVVNTANANDTTKFTFTVTFSDVAATDSFPYTIGETEGTIVSGGTLQLANGETARITGIPDGVTYTVTETPVDGYTPTKSGDTGTIDDAAAQTAAFTNTYAANGEASIVVTKELSGAAWPTGKTLTFTLAGAENAPMPTSATATLSAAGEVSFGPIAYSNTDAGKTYTYTISEDGFGDGWTGSGEITATVAVTDNGDGTLGTTVTYSPENATITNTYVAEGEAVIEVTKELSGAAWPAGKTLTFTLSGEGGALPETKTVELTAAGKATFGAITYNESDIGKTYTYTISEDGFGAGWTGSGSITARVAVTDNGDGTLATEVTYTPDTATITNTYNAEGEASIVVTKKLVGTTWPTGKTLTFTLAGAGGAPMPTSATATLSAEGNVTFGPIAYDEGDVGKTYTYTISEDGFGTGWTGSGTVTANVTVSDKGDGTLETTVTYSPEDAVITNTYVANGEAVIEVTKALAGAEWPAGKTLTFTLSGEGGTLPETTEKELTAAGTVTYDAIKYTEADIGKTYTYTISEDGFGDGWTGSGNVTATVKVTDNGNGTLATEVTYDPTTAIITNTYKATGNATLTADKELTGRAWKSGETVTFTLLDPDGAEIESKTIGENGTVTFTELAYDESDAGQTYVYTISETSDLPGGVTKSADIKATVVVTDNGNGTLATSVTYTNDDKIINTYVTDPVKAQINVAKTIEGYIAGEDANGNVVDRTFEFKLTPVDGAPMPNDAAEAAITITTSGGTGTEAFDEIEYTFEDMKDADGTQLTEKEFTYHVVETEGSDAGFTYDKSTYDVVVTVQDDQEGHLEVTNITKVNETSQANVDVVNTFVEESVDVTLTLTKVIEDLSNSAPDATFTFQLLDADGNLVEEKTITTNQLTGTVDFTPITYDAAGTYNYTLKEIPPAVVAEEPAADEPTADEPAVDEPAADEPAAEEPAADEPTADEPTADEPTAEEPAAEEAESPWTYDEKEYPVVVTVANNFETAELEASVTIDGEDTVSLTVTNIYKAASTEVALEVTKEIEDTSGSAYETTFEFTLATTDDSPMPENTTVTIVGEGTGTFDAVTYEKAGTYNYTITETAGDAEGYIYDTKAYPVVVTVEDENGKLVATAAYGEANETSLTVTNIYDPKDAVAAPQARKVVDDTSGSAPDEEFEFQLLDAEGNVVETVKAPAGYVNFSELTFDKVGTYSYTIKEVSGSTAGFTYDTEGRNLQIVVEDAGKGELKATIDYLNDEGEIVITNPYEPDPASITFTVEKIVEGVSANAKAQDFSFVLSDADGEIQTVTITGAGEASFDEITYDKVGTYNYTIAESKGNAAGYTYDTAVFSITVEVTDNGGTLVAAETITKDGSAADAVTFTNVYTASGTEVDLTGKKVMTGRELKEAEFEFKLEIDGKVVETVRNAKDGSIVFTQLTYEQAGEHTFKIYEVAGSELYVRYDKTVYEGKITVEDNGQGQLVATVTGADSIVFNNAYDKPVTPPTPPTGDNSNLNLWITLMAASGLGFTGVLLIGKKRKKSER